MNELNKTSRSVLFDKPEIKGNRVPLSHVHLREADDLDKVICWAAVVCRHTQRDDEVFNIDKVVEARKQADGGLILYMRKDALVADEIRIAKSMWSEVENNDFSLLKEYLETKQDNEMPDHDNEVKTDSKKCADIQFLIFGREPAGLHLLKNFALNNEVFMAEGSKWADTDNEFLLFCGKKDQSIQGFDFIAVPNIHELYTAIVTLGKRVRVVSEVPLCFYGVRASIVDIIHSKWASMGGLH